MKERLKRSFINRHTLPKDENIGRMIKVTMPVKGIETIIGIGAHLLTDEVNLEVTIMQFNGTTRSFGMGHTGSTWASIDEIKEWLNTKSIGVDNV
jgi:hypothetical protein